MAITRRQFVTRLGALAAAAGFSQVEASKIMEAVAGILEKGMEQGSVRKTDPRLMAYTIVRLHEAFTFSASGGLDGMDMDRTNSFFVELMECALRPS